MRFLSGPREDEPGFLERVPVLLAAVVVAINFALALHAQSAYFHHFANSADEYAYEISAKIFARGRLSVPSPLQREFFDVRHVVNDGKFYGKYSPGWPALLAVGEVFGVPWLVNPLLGAVALILIAVLAKRTVSARAAILACLLLLANPFLVLNSASKFSHLSCLVFVLLAALFLDRAAQDPRRMTTFVGLGAFAGLAFVVRQYTTLVLLAVPGLALLPGLRDRNTRAPLLRGLALAAVAFSALVGVLLAYNQAQTGHALLSPFTKYNPHDTLTFPATLTEALRRVESLVFKRALELGRWLPLAPLLAAAAIYSTATRANRSVRIFAASSFVLFVAYYFYPVEGGVRYGPRYLFESLGFLVVTSSALLASLPAGRGLVLALLLVVLNVHGYQRFGRDTSAVIRVKGDLQRCVAKAGLDNAIVFLKDSARRSTAEGFTRNGLDFDGPVLFVRDLGVRNERLLAAFPGREPWRYDYRAGGKGHLTPYSAGRAARKAPPAPRRPRGARRPGLGWQGQPLQ